MMQLSLFVILFALTLSHAEKPKMIFTVLDESTEGIDACEGTDIVSCVKVKVDFDAFENEDSLEFPDGIVMSKQMDEMTSNQLTYSGWFLFLGTTGISHY